MASPTQQSPSDSTTRYSPAPLPPKAVYPAPAPARIVVLVSGSGSNLQALLDAADDPSYGAAVVAVGADRGGILALKRAEDAGVPTFVRSLRDYPDRAAWDRALRDEVVQHAPDLVVCAGFMKLLGPGFLAEFGGRVVNTHPALLPSFPGMHGARDALAYGVKVTGCTLFVVAAGIDDGPIIAQAAVPVEEDDDEASLHERIKVAERRLLVEHVGRMVREGWTITAAPAVSSETVSSETVPPETVSSETGPAEAAAPATGNPTIGNRKVTIP